MAFTVSETETKGRFWKLLFDGECPMCTKFAAIVSRFDSENRIEIISLQKYTETEVFPAYDDLMKDVHLLGRDGRILKGAEALQMVIQTVPASKPYRWMIGSRAGAGVSKAAYSAMKLIRGCTRCGRHHAFSRGR